MSKPKIALSLAVLAVAIPLFAGLGAISAACAGTLLLLAMLVAGLEYSHGGWKRLLVRAGIVLVAPVLLVLLTIFSLIEQGETVVLRTSDRSGTVEETRLWIVDYDGSPWLGAGGGETRRWFARLQENPRVEVLRNGSSRCFDAKPDPDPAIRDAVIGETRRKYRLGNLGLSIGNSLGIPMRTDSIAIPVRLVACN